MVIMALEVADLRFGALDVLVVMVVVVVVVAGSCFRPVQAQKPTTKREGFQKRIVTVSNISTTPRCRSDNALIHTMNRNDADTREGM